jgi:anti-sigma factor RsiW
MNCTQAERYLSAYVDGELSGAEMLRVRDHVSRCAACGRELESLRQVKGLLRALPVQHPEEEPIERLCDALGNAPAPSGLLARALRAIAEAFGPTRSRATSVALIPLALLAIVFAQYAFNMGPGANNATNVDLVGNPSHQAAVVGAHMETDSVMPLLGPSGTMTSPELQIAVDASMSRHFGAVPADDNSRRPPR